MRIFKRGKFYHLELNDYKRVSLQTTDHKTAVKKAEAIYGPLKNNCLCCGKRVGHYRSKYCSNECRRAWHHEIVYFGLLKKDIVAAFGGQCAACGNDQNLCVHHVDGNGCQVPLRERNNKEDNLIVLCRYCHAQIHLGLYKEIPGPDAFWVGRISEKVRMNVINEMKTIQELQRRVGNVSAIRSTRVPKT